MIHIDRKRIDPPKILTGKDERGPRETERAIEHMKNTPDEPFKFRVYSDPKVKQALIELFESKCAYCESKFLHVYSGDIEHFRPKGEIEEAHPSKPGYYWLAADWDNLLLSCRNCNQKLKHEIVGEDKKKTMGKMNQFPLANGFKHVQSHENHPQSIKTEDKHRLLLDPCKDNPQEHLSFDEKTAVIRAESDKGRASIEVFVLQRVPLVQAREKVLIEIWAQVERVRRASVEYDESLQKDPVAKQVYYDRILKMELQRLKNYTNTSREYTAMAKQIIDRFLDDFLN